MQSSGNRQFSRAGVDFPVTVEIDAGSGNTWTARALNISVGGILLWSTRNVPMNVPLIVHFPFEWTRAFAVAKAVRHDGYFYGCEFIDLPQKVVEALDTAVSHYIHHAEAKPLNTLWQDL
ncbi:MAG: PilZ domain-containing protein [Negativicutes bacterium]|nr:PilZ domain-containing protein [Negativicutes bacterium]